MSGIYISNMGMPQRDEVITIYPDGTAHRHHLGLRLHISESKAVPVPDHGRLIDKDWVASEEGPYDYEDWVNWKLDRFIDAPVVIPADKEE